MTENFKLTGTEKVLNVTYDHFYTMYKELCDENIKINLMNSSSSILSIHISATEDNYDLNYFLTKLGFKDKNYPYNPSFVGSTIDGVKDVKILSKICYQRYKALVDVADELCDTYKIFHRPIVGADSMHYYLSDMILDIKFYKQNVFEQFINEERKAEIEKVEKYNKSLLGHIFPKKIYGGCGYHHKVNYVITRKLKKCPSCGEYSYYHYNDGYYNGYCDLCGYNWHEGTMD